MKSFVILSIFFLSVVAGERFARQVNQGFQGFAGFPFPQPFNIPQPQIGQPGTQGTFVSSSQTLNSRFGEEPVSTGQHTIIQTTGNKYQQTNTFVRPDGTVTTNKQSGRVRRDTPPETPVKSDQFQGGNTGSGQQQQQQQPINSQQQPVHAPQQPVQAPQQPINPPQESHHAQPNPDTRQQQQQQQPNYEQQQQQPNYQQQQPNSQQQQPNYQQQQPNYQQQPQQPYYPQQQQFPGNQFPFGIGMFGVPQLGFQQPFGFPQFGFFPQQPIPAAPIQPGPGVQTGFVGATQTLDNRFGEETVAGGSQIITSNNGNYQITSSVLKPDGQVVTSQQSGTINKKP